MACACPLFLGKPLQLALICACHSLVMTISVLGRCMYAQADWAGAQCWARLSNDNYIRMNMTATISWSLIWSVYQQVRVKGKNAHLSLTGILANMHTNTRAYTHTHARIIAQDARFHYNARGGHACTRMHTHAHVIGYYARTDVQTQACAP